MVGMRDGVRSFIFWVMIVGAILIIALATMLITNPSINRPEKRAEEFLKTYYTIENTDIADLFYDPQYNPILRDEPIGEIEGIDENGYGIVEVKGVEEAVKVKYGDLMTKEAIERASANRTILIGEMTAREYETRLEAKKINIDEEKISGKGIITYNFEVEALVKFNNDTDSLVKFTGTIDMIEVEGIWKVSNFKHSNLNFLKALTLIQPNLYITNISNAPIRIVEVSVNGSTNAIMNADNTDIDKNYRFDFEMMDAKELNFSVKLLDKDDKVLLKQSFINDFSDDKVVQLFIEEDEKGNLSIK